MGVIKGDTRSLDYSLSASVAGRYLDKERLGT